MFLSRGGNRSTEGDEGGGGGNARVQGDESLPFERIPGPTAGLHQVQKRLSEALPEAHAQNLQEEHFLLSEQPGKPRGDHLRDRVRAVREGHFFQRQEVQTNVPVLWLSGNKALLRRLLENDFPLLKKNRKSSRTVFLSLPQELSAKRLGVGRPQKHPLPAIQKAPHRDLLSEFPLQAANRSGCLRLRPLLPEIPGLRNLLHEDPHQGSFHEEDEDE